MKQDKKKLYESIMSSVAKLVKKSINEGFLDDLQPVPGASGDTIAHELAKFLVKNKVNEDLLKDLILVTNNPVEYKYFGLHLRNYIKRYTKVFESFGDDYYDDEVEDVILYYDIIDAVEGQNYQKIIANNGEEIGEEILDSYEFEPENSAGVYNACVYIAKQLLAGEDADTLRREIGEKEI